ncbi:MAG: hypothetical protein V1898_03625 [Patescibacteria group bacterium]
MFAQKKFIIIVTALLALLFIGFGVIFYIYQNHQTEIKPENSNTNIAVNNTNNQIDNQGNIIIDETNNNANSASPAESETFVATQANQTNAILKLAKNFAERFGTYSNENNYDNIRNLKNISSTEMQAWLETLIDNNSKKPNEAFSAVTTKALTVDLLSFDVGSNIAEVMVSTSRSEEAEFSTEKKTYTQKIKIEIIQENNSWKINRAYWQ